MPSSSTETGRPAAPGEPALNAEGPEVGDPSGPAGRLQRAYREAGVVLLNTVVLLLVTNVVLAGVFAVKDYRMHRYVEEYAAANTPAQKYGKGFMAEVYPGWSDADLDRLMAESWGRPFSFEPYTQFRERPVRGKYVNIDAHGFRRSPGQGPWPPREESFNLFFFGGSTTFGYGLPDGETIPAYVQEILAANPCRRPVAVYNFGRGFYFSTQERIAFEQLLAAGHVPDLAVFVDGLNDFYHRDNVPSFSDRLEAAVEGGTVEGAVEDPGIVGKIPMVRAAQSLLKRLQPAATVRPASAATTPREDSAAAARVIDRWFANRAIAEAVGERFGAPVLFAWQPVPTYGHDLAHHPFSGGSLDAFKEHKLSWYGYPMMKERLAAEAVPNLLWLAELQHGRQEKLYVDLVHYTGRFSREIAQRIAERILADGAVCGAPGS